MVLRRWLTAVLASARIRCDKSRARAAAFAIGRHPIWIRPPLRVWTATGIVVAVLGGLALGARRTEPS